MPRTFRLDVLAGSFYTIILDFIPKPVIKFFWELRVMKWLNFWLAAGFLLAPCGAQAAEPVDFSYRGLYLGDDEAKLLATLEPPLYHKEISVQGIRVRQYTFKRDITIGVAMKTGEIIDIQIKDENYEARDGVRFGATGYKIQQTYGKAARSFLDGVTYYIYDSPTRQHQHLLIALDGETGSLTSWRITGLPLDDDEADEMALTDGDGDDSTSALEDWRLADKEIDTSRLPKDKPVRLGGLT